MNIKKFWQEFKWFPIVVAGCAIFSLGFDLFLDPHKFNCGGLSGLAQVFVKWFGVGTVGQLTALMNIPLFIIGGLKIGKKFFLGSFVGMIAMSLFLDLFAMLPIPETEPLLGALYGGVVTGLGMGLVFLSTVSSGGTDIIVRLLKMRHRNVPIGKISLTLDVSVALLTGIVFHDFSKTLYSGVTLFVSSMIIDAVIYKFDYSKVVLIISQKHDQIGKVINDKLGRGVTLLHGEGFYSHNDTQVILSAIKRQQVTELKEVVVEVDPNAFIILQEAHQVLGDGFAKYSKDSL